MRFFFRFRGFSLVVDLLVSAMLVSISHLIVNWSNAILPKCSLWHCHVWMAPADQGLFCGDAMIVGAVIVFGPIDARALRHRQCHGLWDPARFS